MGNRFQGGIAPGAMPSLHRYLGNPVLSFVGRLFFRHPVGDFHCGLRGFRRDVDHRPSSCAPPAWSSRARWSSRRRSPSSTSREVPTTLRPDGRSRPPHLRSWRDGWRHLRFLLLYSPRWLFLYPGPAAHAAGPGRRPSRWSSAPSTIGGVGFDVGTLLFAWRPPSSATRRCCSPCSATTTPSRRASCPRARFHGFRSWLDLEKSIGLGVGIFLLGVVLSFVSVWQWRDAGFGEPRRRPTASARRSRRCWGWCWATRRCCSALFLSFLRIRVVRPAPEVPVEVVARAFALRSAEPAADHVGERLLDEVAADGDTPARGPLRG